MPIYEYQCAACGHVLEALQKIGEAPMVDCPACNQAELQKIVSASSFQLKGTGWYATDFKTKPPAAKTESNTAAPAANDTTSTTAPAASGDTASAKSTSSTDTKTDKST